MGFNERVKERIVGLENFLVFYFVSMFGMFCVLNGSGDFIFFLGVVYFSMMVFIYNDFLIIQSTLFYKKNLKNLHEL